MNIRTIFTEQSKPAPPSVRYGMLAVCILLLALHILWRLNMPADYSGDRNMNGVVALMLLFNHLAFQFRWSTRVTIALRVLAWSWLIFGCYYVSSVLLFTLLTRS